MNNNTKILLGVGAAAAVYLLWEKSNKDKANDAAAAAKAAAPSTPPAASLVGGDGSKIFKATPKEAIFKNAEGFFQVENGGYLRPSLGFATMNTAPQQSSQWIRG